MIGARTTCLIHEANAASIRVAAKLGFREIAYSLHKGTLVNVYERVRG